MSILNMNTNHLMIISFNCSTAIRAVKPVVCSTQLSPTKKPLVVPQCGKKLQFLHEEVEDFAEEMDEVTQSIREDSSQKIDEDVDESTLSSVKENDAVQMAPPPVPETFTADAPKKVTKRTTHYKVLYQVNANAN